MCIRDSPNTIEQIHHEVRNLQFKLEKCISKLEEQMEGHNGEGRENINRNSRISEMQ